MIGWGVWEGRWVEGWVVVVREEVGRERRVDDLVGVLRDPMGVDACSDGSRDFD